MGTGQVANLLVVDTCSEHFFYLCQNMQKVHVHSEENTLDSPPDALVLETVLQCTEAEAGLIACCLCTCTNNKDSFNWKLPHKNS